MPNQSFITALGEALARAGGWAEEGSFKALTHVLADFAEAAVLIPDSAARAGTDENNFTTNWINNGIRWLAQALADALEVVPNPVFLAYLFVASTLALYSIPVVAIVITELRHAVPVTSVLVESQVNVVAVGGLEGAAACSVSLIIVSGISINGRARNDFVFLTVTHVEVVTRRGILVVASASAEIKVPEASSRASLPGASASAGSRVPRESNGTRLVEASALAKIHVIVETNRALAVFFNAIALS